MPLRQRIVAIGLVCTALVAIWAAMGTAKNVAVQTVGEWPYANQRVEVVVAGWQQDRARAELRDVNERIERLQNRRARSRGRFDSDDQKTLDNLHRDKDNLERLIKEIDSTRKPVVGK